MPSPAHAQRRCSARRDRRSPAYPLPRWEGRRGHEFFAVGVGRNVLEGRNGPLVCAYPPRHRRLRWRALTESRPIEWTHIKDQDDAAKLLPAWLGRRLIGQRGRFGLLLTTGNVVRITCIGAVHLSSDGLVLLDVSLDHAGVPDGVDLAWQAKHYLGAPCPGGDEASVNLAHVVAAVEFVAVEIADLPVRRTRQRRRRSWRIRSDRGRTANYSTHAFSLKMLMRHISSPQQRSPSLPSICQKV